MTALLLRQRVSCCRPREPNSLRAVPAAASATSSLPSSRIQIPGLLTARRVPLQTAQLPSTSLHNSCSSLDEPPQRSPRQTSPGPLLRKTSRDASVRDSPLLSEGRQSTNWRTSHHRSGLALAFQDLCNSFFPRSREYEASVFQAKRGSPSIVTLSLLTCPRTHQSCSSLPPAHWPSPKPSSPSSPPASTHSEYPRTLHDTISFFPARNGEELTRRSHSRRANDPSQTRCNQSPHPRSIKLHQRLLRNLLSLLLHLGLLLHRTVIPALARRKKEKRTFSLPRGLEIFPR